MPVFGLSTRIREEQGDTPLQSAQRAGETAEDEARSQEALRYILDAWEEALHDGIEPEMLANAALFAALADLIGVLWRGRRGQDDQRAVAPHPAWRVHAEADLAIGRLSA